MCTVLCFQQMLSSEWLSSHRTTFHPGKSLSSHQWYGVLANHISSIETIHSGVVKSLALAMFQKSGLDSFYGCVSGLPMYILSTTTSLLMLLKLHPSNHFIRRYGGYRSLTSIASHTLSASVLAQQREGCAEAAGKSVYTGPQLSAFLMHVAWPAHVWMWSGGPIYQQGLRTTNVHFIHHVVCQTRWESHRWRWTNES